MSRTKAFTIPRPMLSDRAMGFYALLTSISFSAVSAAPTPLYHFYQQTLGLSPLLVTVIFACYSFSMLIAFVTVASLSDYVGRRPMILAALLINAAALVLFIVAQSAATLILARVVQGVATGIALTTLGATILDTDRKNGPLYNSVTAMIGLSIGAILAGALLAFAPLPGQLVYIVLLAVTLLEAALLAVLPETAERRAGALASLTPHITLPAVVRPHLVRLFPLNLAAWALGGFYLSLMPTLVGVATGIKSPFVGAAVVSILPLTAAATVFVLRQIAPERLVVFAIATLGLGIAVTLGGTALESVPVMIGGTVIAGAGFGAAFSGNLRTLLPLADESDRAGLLALYFIESYLAYSLPAILAGLLVPVLGLVTTAYLYGGALIVLTLLSLIAIAIENRRSTADIVSMARLG